MGNHIESEGIKEISINYIESGESYNRETTIVDIYFASEIAEILQLDPEPKTVRDCLKRPDWPKWKEAIEAELHLLNKEKYFPQ